MSPRELSELILRGLGLYETIRDAFRPENRASEIEELGAIFETLRGIDRKSTTVYSKALPELKRRFPNPPLEGFHILKCQGEPKRILGVTSWHEAAVQFLSDKVISMNCLVSVKESLIESEDYPSDVIEARCFVEAEILGYLTPSAQGNDILERLNEVENRYRLAKGKLQQEGKKRPPIDVSEFVKWMEEEKLTPEGFLEECKTLLPKNKTLIDSELKVSVCGTLRERFRKRLEAQKVNE